jgi:Ca2+-binding RTX toxin-like protein
LTVTKFDRKKAFKKMAIMIFTVVVFSGFFVYPFTLPSVSADDIDGTSGNDNLNGGNDDDNIDSGDGDDTNSGNGGDDDIDSGDGVDINIGDSNNCSGDDCSGGDDTINSGEGDDSNYGQGGDDTINRAQVTTPTQVEMEQTK